MSKPSDAPSAARIAIFAAAAVLVLGVVGALGVVHPRLPAPPLQSYLPSITPLAVATAGLLDGINPCAFTVLLLLIAALLATTQVGGAVSTPAIRRRVMLLGSVYVAAVFVTYLALGFGLLGAGFAFTSSHVPSRVGAFVAVLLGLWMLKDALLPGAGLRLEAPHGLTRRAQAVARHGTVPALVAGGVLVGLCTVPCSGAVYLAVVALLAAEATRVRAYGYLVLYNLLFIVPLLAILLGASSRRALARLARWQERRRDQVRLVIGSVVVLLGLGLLAMI